MNEKILDVLMRLFALFSSVKNDDMPIQSRQVVQMYLKTQLSNALVKEYMQRFDNYVKKNNPDDIDLEKQIKRQSLNSVKILKICTQINQFLNQKEKFIVLVQLAQFIFVGGIEMNDDQKEFIFTVSNAFNISEMEYNNIIAFVKMNPFEAVDKSKLLLIDSSDEQLEDIKHQKIDNFKGSLSILFIESIKIFFFLYEGSENIYIDGRRIDSERAFIFDNGSILNCDGVKIYQNQISSLFLSKYIGNPITFSGKDVSFSFKNSDNGLKNFSFEEHSGTLIAVMGGSGTGKSTLFNILSGKRKNQTGNIYINGYDIWQDRDKLEGIIGFVPQDDLLIEELTVYENLYLNAQLCLGNLKQEEISNQVDTVLKELDLYESKNLKVGDAVHNIISGGQRKRLNIALELLREPALLFVDEPTSGLSSTDSENVMQLLKQLSLKGKIIIVNIHQPSSDIFKTFDKLWILDKGGYIIYNGNPVEGVTYFKREMNLAETESQCQTCGHINTEQILQIVEKKQVNEYGKATFERVFSPEQWYNKFNEKIVKNQSFDISRKVLPEVIFKIPSAFKQFGVFCKRNILSKLSNTQYLLINILEAPLLAFILGFFTKYINDEGQYVFADNKNLPVFLFMLVVCGIFFGLMLSAEEIIRDRKILEREKFLNLSRFAYINSKVLVMFFISAVQSFLFVLISSLILEIRGMLFTYWFVMFTTMCVSNMLGLNLSSAMKTVVSVYILIPFVIVPQLLLGGAMLDYDDLHKSVSDKVNVPFIGDLMFSRWAYEAIAVEQFKNNEYEKNLFEIDKLKSYDVYLSTYHMSELENVVSRCIQLIGDTANYQDYVDNLKILKNETEFLNYRNPELHFEHTDKFVPELFDEFTGNFVLLFLRAQKEYYIDEASDFSAYRQTLLEKMEDSLGKDGLEELRVNYYNEKLAEIVLARTSLKKIYHATDRHRLIQKKDPIFMEPISDCGRAHFYAPVKIIQNHRFNTFHFNMSVLWITTVILYILLLSDGLKKFLQLFPEFSFRKR